MTPEEALRDLFEISTDVRAAALLDASGTVVAAVPGEAPQGLAAAAAAFAAAGAAAAAGAGAAVHHVVVPLADGVVALVEEGAARAVALTGPRPAVPLLVFDLRTCLRQAFPGTQAGAEEARP